MLPERRGASLGPRGRRADSAPRGALSTGLLRGLVQGAGPPPPPPPPFFCLPLPRVHAADVAAAQSAQMPTSTSTSTTSPASVPVPSHSSLPSSIGKPEFPDTGWERIKDLFDRDSAQSYPEEISNAFKCATFGALAGFLYGGVPGARHARQRYIQLSQAEMYSTRVEAVRSAHNAAIRGFMRYGWRWSWRVSVIVSLFNSVSTGLSVYRDKDAVSHYVAAGAVTVGLFRLNLGLRGLVAGTVIGAVLGMPVGALLIGLQTLAGETIRERRRRERRELYEHKLQEWTARLQLTDELIDSLDVAAREEETNKDMQRIQELLSLPKNQDV
ncbi:complex I assembly factor TIMMDC1, mitochondrial [Mugil cephalus]|uniref:complex I assembly factor TIMMDC1, mitochondrial n=1 Tax=Mugil cephalus TaxID=48193 RepID=UPI001FB604DF|nr:complex I assembly factor TIMMDC1, mitochondrial [Mugil cephalus]